VTQSYFTEMTNNENIVDGNVISFEQDMKQAIDTLRKGGIILYPTDTVWGIGCDAANSEAIERIFKLKQRSEAKSMIVLVGSEAQLESAVIDMPDVAWQLIDAAVRPTTIVYDNVAGIAPELKAEDGSVGVRLSNERYSKELCKRLRRPIVSTSANISGEKTPQIFDEISETIKSGVDYIAYYRQDDRTKSEASNIIKIKNNGEVKIIR
jgi:L-threonylcarbamoyladenylate synthase